MNTHQEQSRAQKKRSGNSDQRSSTHRRYAREEQEDHEAELAELLHDAEFGKDD